MSIFTITGMIVAFIGFIVIKLSGIRWGKDIGLYALITVVFLSLLAPFLLFEQHDATSYRLGWMLVMVALVIFSPRRKKAKNANSDNAEDEKSD